MQVWIIRNFLIQSWPEVYINKLKTNTYIYIQITENSFW